MTASLNKGDYCLLASLGKKVNFSQATHVKMSQMVFPVDLVNSHYFYLYILMEIGLGVISQKS